MDDVLATLDDSINKARSAVLSGSGDPPPEAQALTDLARLHERQARVVELRFFGGLELREIAEVLEVSPRTVDKDWRAAKAWLRSSLEADPA